VANVLKILATGATSASPVTTAVCPVNWSATCGKPESVIASLRKLFFTTCTSAPAGDSRFPNSRKSATFIPREYVTSTKGERFNASDNSETMLVFSGRILSSKFPVLHSGQIWAGIDADAGGHSRTDCHTFKVAALSRRRTSSDHSFNHCICILHQRVFFKGELSNRHGDVAIL